MELESADASAPLAYETADNLAVLAENCERDVCDVAAALGFAGLRRSLKLALAAPSAGCDDSKVFKAPFPTPCTVGDALAKYCDLSARPTRRGLASLTAALLKSGSADARVATATRFGVPILTFRCFGVWSRDAVRGFWDFYSESVSY